MFKKFFESWYFKHQNKNQTFSVIPGISSSGTFIQIITNENSYNVVFQKSQFSMGNNIKIGNNLFSVNGIKLNINTKGLNINGEIFYHDLTPLSRNIMGPFRFLSMACRNGIISMHHNINGQVKINNSVFDFNGGTGYIEKDNGCASFQKVMLGCKATTSLKNAL